MLDRCEYDRLIGTNARKDGDWIVCGTCGKRLEKVVSESYSISGIERKCPNCKSINAINIKGEV